MVRVAPTICCFAPSRAFRTQADAVEYARRAASGFGITYSVYDIGSGKPRHVATFPPPRQTRARRSAR
jgi:hypothetical protein